MEVQLKVLVGGNTGQALKVPGPKFFIGRAEDCHLRPRSDLVSRHHCVLIVEDSTVLVRDFGSKNGTLVNDERITGEVELKAGDELKVGPLHFEMQIDISKSKKRPKVNSIKEAAARTAESAAQARAAAEKDEAANDGVDLDDWLSDDEGAEPAETRELPKKVDTQTLDMEQTVEMPAPPPQPEEESKQAPKAPPPSSDNAAADMLRKLRKFR